MRFFKMLLVLNTLKRPVLRDGVMTSIHLQRSYFESSNMSTTSSTVRDLYKQGIQILCQHGTNVSDPEDSMRYMLQDVIQSGYAYSTFTKSLDTQLTTSQKQKLDSHLQRRLQNEVILTMSDSCVVII
jgi:hypothetical protein